MNTTPEPLTNSHGQIFTMHSVVLANLNKAIMNGFLQHYEDEGVKRTHLFNGRYENIYLNEDHVPELKALLGEACHHANHILGAENISAGCWFNYMPATSVTTAHSHDDYDELLSAVYYVDVPVTSGKLILHIKNRSLTIEPKSGMFVFFPPDIVHEVTENKSGQDRLSVGINFGIK